MGHPPRARDDVLLVRVEQVAERQAVLDPDQAQRGREAEQRKERARPPEARHRRGRRSSSCRRAPRRRPPARARSRPRGWRPGGRRSRASRRGRRAGGRGSCRRPPRRPRRRAARGGRSPGRCDRATRPASRRRGRRRRPRGRARGRARWSSSRSSSSSCSSTTIRQASAPAAPASSGGASWRKSTGRSVASRSAVDRGHDREALGALLLGGSSAVGVADEGDDRDPVPFRDRLAEGCAPGHCADPTSADRVPDGLQLEEGGDLPRALLGRRAVDDALDVLGRELLELGREAVGAGDVDRVDVHVGREPRGELGALAGEDVDDAARDVGGGEHLAELDRGERVVLGGDDDDRVAADDRGGDPRDEALERRLLGGEDPDDAGRLRES